ncbi:MAG: N-acetylglucosamine-6-phosphate deacetylase [Xanthomonadales bacterium]|jgi:N-acetylglucosamine-6-phosphate deacetylase|nr:N-acetylglucosamine-6-phosphate deacetylase [Xanthomonadales bacterium]
MSSALINARIFDGERLHTGLNAVIENGRIGRLTSDAVNPEAVRTRDLEGRLLAPGLIDIQVNGGGGVMFNDDPCVETIRRMGAAHRHFGTTGFLPTLISSSPETLLRAVAAVRTALEEKIPGLLGIHLEGPFLNPEYRGIHDDHWFRSLRDEDFGLFDLPGGARTLLTVAPEMMHPGQIRQLVEAGVIVFGGHSAASYEQVRVALQAGMSGFTHLFNAMSPFTSREPGMVGAALADRESWVGLIADGHHVHPASLAVALAAKTAGRSLLVTDAMASVGQEAKSFEWNGQTVTAADGCCRLPGGALAGSDLDMMTAVRNTMRFAGMDRYEALRMASTYPAQALGLDTELGYIKPGYRASMIELDENMVLKNSWIDGRPPEATEENT